MAQLPENCLRLQKETKYEFRFKMNAIERKKFVYGCIFLTFFTCYDRLLAANMRLFQWRTSYGTGHDLRILMYSNDYLILGQRLLYVLMDNDWLQLLLSH